VNLSPEPGIYLSRTMKTTTVAAVAALVALTRGAAAQTAGSPGPADDEAFHAAGEARALVATMQTNARTAWQALELARARRRQPEVRCSDEALSRADVALRRAREDAAEMGADFASHERLAARAALQRMRWRAVDSHEAVVTAAECVPRAGVVDGRTSVTVLVAPGLPPGP
jgi:hypothetical protein